MGGSTRPSWTRTQGRSVRGCRRRWCTTRPVAVSAAVSRGHPCRQARRGMKEPDRNPLGLTGELTRPPGSPLTRASAEDGRAFPMWQPQPAPGMWGAPHTPTGKSCGAQHPDNGGSMTGANPCPGHLPLHTPTPGHPINQPFQVAHRCECSNYLAHVGRAIWRYPRPMVTHRACLHRGRRPACRADPARRLGQNDFAMTSNPAVAATAPLPADVGDRYQARGPVRRRRLARRDLGCAPLRRRSASPTSTRPGCGRP